MHDEPGAYGGTAVPAGYTAVYDRRSTVLSGQIDGRRERIRRILDAARCGIRPVNTCPMSRLLLLSADRREWHLGRKAAV